MTAPLCGRLRWGRWLAALLAVACLPWEWRPCGTATFTPGTGARCRRRRVVRRAADEAEASDGPSPEAWREFRAQLISGGIKLTTDEEAPAAVAPRRTVARKNEELLREQNEALWNEYINGAWAHESPVEPGGLLCRRPLCAQVVQQMRSGSSSFWGNLLRSRLERELPQPAEGRSREEVFNTWSQNTNYCYRLAEKVVEEATGRLKARVAKGGSSALREEDVALVTSLQGEMDSWQAVCLVLSVPSGSMTEASEAVVINRPLARQMDETIARLLLNGDGSDGSSMPLHDGETCARCADAFGSQAGIYLGGPQGQRSPGLLVHGFGDLPGAEELAPGTRIYKGGERAAIDGVLEGRFSPLDFRWFVGRQRGLSTSAGEWLAVACARPIALKQCLGLPKPLWHEVMELCGGESAAISRLELTKRQDLDEDVRDEGSEGP